MYEHLAFKAVFEKSEDISRDRFHRRDFEPFVPVNIGQRLDEALFLIDALFRNDYFYVVRLEVVQSLLEFLLFDQGFELVGDVLVHVDGWEDSVGLVFTFGQVDFGRVRNV